MKFKLDTFIPDFQPKINYKDQLFFVGSCFSDEMASKFSLAGFSSLSNPYGTIFHPLPLAKNIESIIKLNKDFFILEYDQRLFHLDASNQISAGDKTIFITELIAKQNELNHFLKNTSHLFITLGTSWGYREKSSQQLVANCHKLPTSFFEKELSSVHVMHASWRETLKELYQFNPSIQVIFTVSPVRHSKEGLIENNRSKARLFELISILENEFPIFYFPSYEIIIDELRDYRFFKDDLIHPSQSAINYIWNQFKAVFFGAETKAIIEQVEKLRKLEQHTILSLNQIEINAFERDRNSKIASFLALYPNVKWK
jgi:hypothetical protein